MHPAKRLVQFALLILVLAAPLTVRADEVEFDEDTEECPGYALHVRNAKAYLARGDRTHALAEIKRAREAIAACGTADIDDTAVAALTVGSPRS